MGTPSTSARTSPLAAGLGAVAFPLSGRWASADTADSVTTTALERKSNKTGHVRRLMMRHHFLQDAKGRRRPGRSSSTSEDRPDHSKRLLVLRCRHLYDDRGLAGR